MTISADDPEFVTALARGLAVINCFGPNADLLTLSEVAKRVDLPRGTARRLLLTLEALSFIRFDGKCFRLTPKVLTLGYAYLSSLPLWRRAQPIMQDVVDRLNQSCSLGVLDGTDVVYIARIPPNHLSYLPVTPGTRMPAHTNAMGQILLASKSAAEIESYMQSAQFVRLTRYTLTDEADIREAICRAARNGYAISDRQIQAGIRSIAVAVPSRKGRPEVAINASAQDDHASKELLISAFLPVLRRAAEELAETV